MRGIWKSKRVWAGTIYLTVLLASSWVYTAFYKHTLPVPRRFIYGENGQILGTHPAPPHLYPPLGTSRFGDPIFLQLLEGAKFTIGLAVVIALLRLVTGMLSGIWLSLYAQKTKRIFRYFGEVFHYIPTIFTAYILIAPVMFAIYDNREQTDPNIALLLYQTAVAVFVVWPSLSLYISDEVDAFMKQDYIISARVLGAGRWHLIRRHMSVLFRDRLFLLFLQHIVQTLILLTHMGLLRLFIGGVQYKELFEGDLRPVSLSNEWSGLIGLNYFEANLKPWVVLGPLAAFALTIFFIKLIAAGAQDALLKREIVTKEEPLPATALPEQQLFVWADTAKAAERD